jgi:hypothetical protein
MGKRLTIEEFIERARNIFGDFYDYSKVDYKNKRTEVIIICPIHGDFEQLAHSHMLGSGCLKCGVIKRYNQDFVEKSKLIHNNKYDYSKVEYKGANNKVCIVCPNHGDFWQVPISHLKGKGCYKCALEERTKTLKNFIQEANKVHNSFYSYDKVVYKTNKIKVCIICPIHGEFWQAPKSHIILAQGCPNCQQSKGEKQIEKWLIQNNIKFIPQKRFEKCKGKRNTLPFDFYLSLKNICIEYDGEQHFSSKEFFGGKEEFEKRKKYDKIKNLFCKNENIILLRISYKEDIELKLQELL